MLLMCCCIDNVLTRWKLTEVFNRHFERNTVSAIVCALTVDQPETRCKANRQNLCFVGVQLKLVATSQREHSQVMSDAGLNSIRESTIMSDTGLNLSLIHI